MSSLHGYVFRSPEDITCSDCGEECRAVPLDNSFAYAGTHCTGGKSGIHKPAGYGEPVSDCCEAECLDSLENVVSVDDCMDFE